MQRIATPNGHTIKFNYDDLSRIIRAEDDKGNWVKYSYNGEGMLESATFSSGQMRRYDYIGALMTAVMDEKGTVLVRNSYESELLTRQQFANGDTFRYSYDWASDRYYPDKVVVTLPDQTTREVRDMLLDVLPVRPREPAGLDGRIVDLEVVALPEQVLGDAHERTLT